MKLVLATRGSALATWQARTTQERLLATSPGLEVELLIVQSTGDQDQKSDLSRLDRTGVFTAEIDAAVLEGRAHLGVHSLKDVPTSLPKGLVLAATLPRGPVEDALVSPSGKKLDELPRGARVATGSVRRVAMLKRARPDLEVVGIRGNVDTRLAKLAAGHADALIMARAGLERLAFGRHVTEVLGPPRFLPAVGQGIVGLICRERDRETILALARIGDPKSFFAALAERSLLARLHGGCNAPVGALARVDGPTVELDACVLSLDGREAIEDRIAGPGDRVEELGAQLAARLVERGAARLVQAARAGR